MDIVNLRIREDGMVWFDYERVFGGEGGGG